MRIHKLCRLTALMLPLFICAATTRGASLDGTKWKVTVTPDKAAADELVFTAGKVTASACIAYGFAPSAYTAEEKAKVMHWQTQQHSDKEGNTLWTGKAEDRVMSGKMV